MNIFFVQAVQVPTYIAMENLSKAIIIIYGILSN